jgi:putative PIN family toxin of toxin-antitoxin system
VHPIVAVASVAAPLRIVLDTNVVLSLYVFSDSRLARLKRELEAGRWLALSNADCLVEYRRVLGYPQFGLSATDQENAMAAYQGIVKDLSGIVPGKESLPVCSDRDDQKFLELARDGGADYLVSADRALLKLARHKRLPVAFRILTPDAAVALIAL